MKPFHIVMAVVGGAVAGTALGLLLAPEKVEDTRKKIAEYLHCKGIKLSKDKMDELVDEIKKEVES